MKHPSIRSCSVCGKRLMVMVEWAGNTRQYLPRSKKVCQGECLRKWINQHWR